jgi:hypothetical protein
MCESLNNYSEWNKPDEKEHMLYDLHSMVPLLCALFPCDKSFEDSDIK